MNARFVNIWHFVWNAVQKQELCRCGWRKSNVMNHWERWFECIYREVVVGVAWKERERVITLWEGQIRNGRVGLLELKELFGFVLLFVCCVFLCNVSITHRWCVVQGIAISATTWLTRGFRIQREKPRRENWTIFFILDGLFMAGNWHHRSRLMFYILLIIHC